MVFRSGCDTKEGKITTDYYYYDFESAKTTLTNSNESMLHDRIPTTYVSRTLCHH